MALKGKKDISMEKIFAIGDIHGCLDKVKALMDALDIDVQRDTVVFLGDYVDRGAHSKEVVDFLLDEVAPRLDHAVFLKGNHEEMLDDYLQGARQQMFLANGGRATIESYERARSAKDDLLPQGHSTFFKNLLTCYEKENYFFVHAGLRPKVPLAEQETWDMLWIRDEFIYSEWDFGKRIIFGHTPFRSPFVMENKIGIDTGAVYGNKLTCVELPSMRFISV